MPSLKDTELRVLLVIIRQTIGYNHPDKPLSISYEALKSKTGRESAAIARALQTLAERKLIHLVASKDGTLLRKEWLTTINSESDRNKKE